MDRKMYYNSRTLVVLFLLCLTFYVQTATLLSAVEPHHATGHCCVLCHVGSLPFLESTSPSSVAPIVVVERLIPNPDIESSHDVLLSSNSSRAPPA